MTSGVAVGRREVVEKKRGAIRAVRVPGGGKPNPRDANHRVDVHIGQHRRAQTPKSPQDQANADYQLARRKALASPLPWKKVPLSPRQQRSADAQARLKAERKARDPRTPGQKAWSAFRREPSAILIPSGISAGAAVAADRKIDAAVGKSLLKDRQRTEHQAVYAAGAAAGGQAAFRGLGYGIKRSGNKARAASPHPDKRPKNMSPQQYEQIMRGHEKKHGIQIAKPQDRGSQSYKEQIQAKPDFNRDYPKPLLGSKQKRILGQMSGKRGALISAAFTAAPAAAVVAGTKPPKHREHREVGKMVGNGVVVGKRLGVAPVLARRVPAAGRNGKRLTTGETANVRAIIGKSDVDKALGWSSIKSGLGQTKAMGTQAFGGMKAGFTGAKPQAPSPLSPMGVRAHTAGVKVGQMGQQANKNRALTGTSLLVGGGIGASVNKRRYDPEDERRHRQGAAAAALGLGGAGLMVQGGRQVRADTRALRDAIPRGADVADFKPDMRISKPRGPNANGKVVFRSRTPEEVAGDEKTHARRVKAHERVSGQLRDLRQAPRGLNVRGRSAAMLGGGLALAGAGATLHSRRREPRWD